jgi:hypothetical protein
MSNTQANTLLRKAGHYKLDMCIDVLKCEVARLNKALEKAQAQQVRPVTANYDEKKMSAKSFHDLYGSKKEHNDRHKDLKGQLAAVYDRSNGASELGDTGQADNLLGMADTHMAKATAFAKKGNFKMAAKHHDLAEVRIYDADGELDDLETNATEQ